MAQSVVHALKGLAYCTARVSLRLACLPRTASSAQRSRHLRSTRAAALVYLAHAEVTKTIILFSMGPNRRYPTLPTLASHTFESIHVNAVLHQECLYHFVVQIEQASM